MLLTADLAHGHSSPAVLMTRNSFYAHRFRYLFCRLHTLCAG
ncbi:hypothetical protein ALP26_103689 [Pseudomonas savastanoi pv. glycinea]|uniref:Uncharacterized protein n=1 Tax=Pseudomonas savastanoi pv. glycinea TaxID=318 RepID=A0A0P9RSA6_PSESG|nr:hypothetical protein ALO37_102861 [Pseudomonas savastanoi pv. glycinea]RML31378.1 hypothetical protein ALQ97_103199 [Pseudomonas savastanoi pv. glycinea]RML88339.1 hypothetical protein ALQ87_102898 [Pseudomonas savastanoi pv. glycinea]RMM61144.1 hypothetical protein ALQ75_103622 [Pseudomonas savastanoi pv. glycinea]RMM90207.1 hypothetical protein ALQ68_103646 [Pseudomonas savastanoi pv. glycinea]